MVVQRKSSALEYERHGQLDLAEGERREIEVLLELLPRPLTGDEVNRAVDQVIQEIGAKTIRDKGRVMGTLKSRFRGRMDFREVGNTVVERLC